jgi:hypothetical protein
MMVAQNSVYINISQKISQEKLNINYIPIYIKKKNKLTALWLITWNSSNLNKLISSRTNWLSSRLLSNC